MPTAAAKCLQFAWSKFIQPQGPEGAVPPAALATQNMVVYAPAWSVRSAVQVAPATPFPSLRSRATAISARSPARRSNCCAGRGLRLRVGRVRAPHAKKYYPSLGYPFVI
jgi:hypothetical protein